MEEHAGRLPGLALSSVNEADGDLLIASRLAGVIRELTDDAETYLCGPKGLKLLVGTAWETQGKLDVFKASDLTFPAHTSWLI